MHNTASLHVPRQFNEIVLFTTVRVGFIKSIRFANIEILLLAPILLMVVIWPSL